MARKSRFKEPRRINILLEGEIHTAGRKRADALNIRGGFSEYVSLLIERDQRRKGRLLPAT